MPEEMSAKGELWWRRISREAEKLKAKKAKVGRVKVKGERVIVDRVCLAGRGEQTEGGGKGWCSNVVINGRTQF